MSTYIPDRQPRWLRIPTGRAPLAPVRVSRRTRRAIKAVAKRYPRFGPVQIGAELHRLGYDVSADAVRWVCATRRQRKAARR